MNSRQDMVPCGFLQIAGAGAAKGQLKLAAMNSSDAAAAELVKHLWEGHH